MLMTPNTVIGVSGHIGILDNDDLLVGIIDAEQRIGFLLPLGIVGNGKGRLHIIAVCNLYL